MHLPCQANEVKYNRWLALSIELARFFSNFAVVHRTVGRFESFLYLLVTYWYKDETSLNAHTTEIEFITKTKFKGRILVVDDDASVGLIYEAILSQAGFYVETVESLSGMLSRLSVVTFDIVLLDLNLGVERGLDGLPLILKDAPFTKVYILTADSSVQRAVDAMQRGASGYFEKGGEVGDLVNELESGMQLPVISDSTPFLHGLVGQSKALLDVVDKITQIKDVDSMILLLGESGTGKEVVARAIHNTSRRCHNHFGAINCGAIPEALLESELFGHAKGAFTDAKSSRKGIFEVCSNGTLLLDEIGDMPLSLQMKLLRVLQEHEITPVGTSQPIKVDTRIIAATHHDILVDAKAKRFREDLYYRLSIVIFHVPPLRQRLEDIPLLVEHFLGVFNLRFSREVSPPSHSLLKKMMSYDWPGNVRELQNALERSVVLSVDGKMDEANVFGHLSPRGSGHSRPDCLTGNALGLSPGLYELGLTNAKHAFEKGYLEHLLTECNGQVQDVATKSGRYRADVYRLLSRHNIDHAQFRS